MEEVISVRIKGDTADLESSSSRSVVSLDTMQTSLAKTESRVASFSAALRAYGANAGVVQQSANKISDALRTMAQSGNLRIEPIVSMAGIQDFKSQLADATRPVKIPVEAERLVIERPIVPAVQLPVNADIAPLLQKLSAASRVVEINIDTRLAQAQADALSVRIRDLQEEITSRKTALPLVADTAAAQAEIRDLEGELSRLQSSLASIKPVSIPVDVQRIEIPDTAPKVTIPVEANLSQVTQELEAVSRPISLKVDTDEATARVLRLQENITALRVEIAEKQAAIPFLTDTTQIAAAQKEIQGLEGEITRLQGRLAGVKSLAVDVTVQTNTEDATRKISLLQTAVASLQNEIAARREVIALETDPTKLAQAQAAVKILEEELSKLQGQINALNPVVKLSAVVEKIAAPTVTPAPIQVPVEVAKINLPPIPVEPISVPVDGNLAPIRAKLDELARPVSLSISADVATAEIKQLAATIETLQGKLGARKEAILIETDPGKLAATNKEIQSLEEEITRLKNIGKSGFDDLGRRVDSFGNAMGKTSRTTGTATHALTDLSRIAGDSAFGLIGISNNISPMLESFQRLKAETGSAKSALASMVGGLIGPGGLILGVNIATSVLIAFGDKLFGATEEEKKLAEEAKKTKEHIDNLTKSLGAIRIDIQGEVAGQVDGQIAKLNSLARVVTDTTRSYQERNRALTELKDINKNYFGDLTLEADKLAVLKGRVNEYTEALTAAAVVKAFQDDIGKVGKELAEVNERIRQTTNSLNGLAGDYNNFGKGAGQKITLLTPEQNAEAQKLRANLREQEGLASKLGTTFNQLRGQIDQAVQTALKFKPLETKDIRAPKVTGDKSKFDFFFQEFAQTPEAVLKALQGLNATDVNLTPLQTRLFAELDKMAKASKDFAIKNFNIFDGLDTIIAAGSSKDVVAAGVKFWDDVKAGLIKLKPPKVDAGALQIVVDIQPPVMPDPSKIFGKAFEKLGSVTELPQMPVDKIVDFYKQQFAAIGAELPNKIGVLNPITGIEQPVDVKAVVNTADLTNGLEKARKEAVKRLEKLNEDITTALKNISTKSFASIGDGIAAAISGGGIQDAFKALGSFIGEAIQMLGEQMIALSPLIAGIQAAIKSFNPALLLPAGIALTALGGIIKNMFANSLPGLATGGIIPAGFPNDTFPAMLSSHEAVIPLDRLASFIGNVGSAQPIVLTQRLRGRDLVLQQAREQKAQRRGG